MDYKAKLQNNNNELEGNNADLYAILDVINNLPSAGSSNNIVNAPELVTITWETVNDTWGNNTDDIIINCNYIGIDDTNTVIRMIKNGKTGTIQCIADSFIEMYTNPIDEEYPNVSSVNGFNNIYYSSVGGGDSSAITLFVTEDSHFTIKCVVPSSDW